ncbi:TetR/AcrR family transcriptional regulator [Paenibacillus rhizovicinus]|uniref:TetR/AcrR family transcriptional regulator n=1 Tax=Paenibacillus rhizovicinus TaxID=2704463 RepID=A0A6C0P1F7_9BACL|nr:TetR/AcrR family transcriptional regulator [Paenibacillus rhizovicinus]QHW32380.1 TetR/AcrR family transcriptional regulator [Paenibacillus rhizovicinus]
MARSKEFELNVVLDKAMDIFWRQGYEKTSIQELVDGMGIHRRSLYDTFGDKHQLFMDVLNRYNSISNSNITNRIYRSNSAKEAIRQLFEMLIGFEENQPKGCLIVNTAVELSLLDPEVAVKIQEQFYASEQLFYDLLAGGQHKGEIPEHYDAMDLSLYLHNAWVGLRVMVKTTEDKEKLNSIINTTLAFLG